MTDDRGSAGRIRDLPLWRLSATVVCMVALPIAARADYIPPAGLAPGDSYRLIFVTPTSTPAASTDISFYNSFASTAAGGNTSLPSTTWRALASTDSVSAVNNLDGACNATCQSVPIYLVDGTEVAANEAQLFGGSLLHAIDENELGGASNPSGYFISDGFNPSGYVWTGSTHNGGIKTGLALGDRSGEAGSSQAAGVGTYTSGGTTYYASGYIESSFVANANQALCAGTNCGSASTLPLYAVSGQLTVPGLATPEPASGGLLLAGGAMVGLVRRLRRKRPISA